MVNVVLDSDEVGPASLIFSLLEIPLDVLVAASKGFSFLDPVALAFLAGGVAVFVAIAALTHAHEKAFSASIVYLLGGVLVSTLVNWLGHGPLVDPVDDHILVEYLTTAAMIVALFATGIRLARPLSLRAWGTPLRLLVVAMPLTILLVSIWGHWVMGLSAAAALALASALAPTDPVLAGDLGLAPPGEQQREEQEEKQAEPLFALTAEAGANDGLALPFLILAAVLAGGVSAGEVGSWLGIDVAYAVSVGLAGGFGLGYLLGVSTLQLRRRGLLGAGLDGWLGLAAPLLVYGLAEIADSYGFLAVVAAGVGFRYYESGHERNRAVHDGGETVKHFAELAVVGLLGVMFTLDGLDNPGLSGWLLAPLLLLLVRPATVFVSLLGSGLRRRQQLYLAWFGVKGVASLNYLALALGLGVLQEGELSEVAWTIMAVVSVSIVAHGSTADPLSRRWLSGGEKG